jgi:hypothetical protein
MIKGLFLSPNMMIDDGAEPQIKKI